MRYLLYSAGLVFAFWTAATSLTQVESHQVGVVRRFGRILPHKATPGLHVGLPWGIDRVELASVGRDRDITVGFSESAEAEEDVIPVGQMLTGDHNLVNVTATINFRVSAKDDDPDRYVLNKEQVELIVARAAESLMVEWVAGRKVDEVLQQGQNKLPRFLLEHLPGRLAVYQMGVQVERVSASLKPPSDDVRKAFDRLTQAQSSIVTRVKEAEQLADKRYSETASKIDAIHRQTEAYAAAERSSAATEAKIFQERLTQYRTMSRTNPDYLKLVWEDEITRMYRKMSEEGRIDLLDHYLSSDSLTITQFPLLPKKK